MYKLFMNILMNRLSSKLDEILPVEQAGFRKNFSTSDHILTLQYLIYCSQIYNFSFSLLFIDYEKAFDSVNTSVILETLQQHNIDEIYLKIFQDVYSNSKMIIEHEGLEEHIEIRRGLKQGDPASAKLYCASQEEAYRNISWNGYGININGTWLNSLKFADDKVIIGKNIDEIRTMLDQLVQEGRAIGLKINAKKTKIMHIGQSNSCADIMLNGEKIEAVSQFTYLGQIISSSGQAQEHRSRIAKAWRAFWKYKFVFMSPLEIHTKVRLWNSCVLPVMLYGAETWMLNTQVLKKYQVAARSMIRVMLGIRKSDRKSNDWLLKQTGMEDVAASIIRRKWKWAGHIMRTEDERWVKRVLEWHPMTSRRRGRPGTRWDQEFRERCGGATWGRVARVRTEWKRMTNIEVNKWCFRK